MQVKAARLPQTSQSGSAFKGRGADAAAGAGTAAVGGDGLLEAPAFFSPFFFVMVVVGGSDELMISLAGASVPSQPHSEHQRWSRRNDGKFPLT